MNKTQLIFFPIICLVLIIFLANWLRDLIILEWDITSQFASILGLILMVFVSIFCCFIIYCIIKINEFSNKLIEKIPKIAQNDVVWEFIEEYNRIKNS